MRYKMEKKYQLFLEEYRALVNKYQTMFNEPEPALIETDWDFDKQVETMLKCIETKTPFVHEPTPKGYIT